MPRSLNCYREMNKSLVPRTSFCLRRPCFPVIVVSLGVALLFALPLVFLRELKVATAEPPTPAVVQARIRRWRESVLSPLPSSLLDRERPGPTDKSASTPLHFLEAWNRVAYMSYQWKNWDIYVAQGTVDHTTRLTTHKAIDSRPRLNRGATRVVFTSNRDGNWEVYAINTDRSGLTRLTVTGADEAGPVWSPDGQRIAFASQRDGNWEIYVMNADGSAQTRLTDDIADDVMPTWSPDGTRIAWVRRGNLAGAIWIMNADGSHAYELTPMLPLLENVVWSPDGTQLAFDCDTDGDYFNEVVSINADGTGLHTVYRSPLSQSEAWMGSWSPTSDWILFTEVGYYEWKGQLYLNNTYIERVTREGRALAVWADWHLPLLPDWQSADIVPPHAKVRDLPPYARAAGFLVQWSGADVGDAGLSDFAVQYRYGATGSWTDWIASTAETSATFLGGAGKRVYFRVRARDNAGNVESWPAGGEGDASTNVYTWQFSGQVTDNRDIPLPHATVSITPSPWNNTPTDTLGQFWFRLTGTGEQTLHINHAGYAPVPPFSIDIGTDRTHNYVLNPLDNLVRNGGFEDRDTDFAPWAVEGTLPVTLTSADLQTGMRSAVLGEPCPLPCLSDPETIMKVLGVSSARPGLVEDHLGNIHVLWATLSPGAAFYAYRRPTGEWTAPSMISEPGDIRDTGLVVDNQDTLHAIWSDKGDVYYTERPSGGDWSTPVIIGQGAHSEIGADRLGNVHVIFTSGRILYHRVRLPSGTWEEPFSVNDTTGGAYEAHLAVGPDGTVYVGWEGYEPNANSPDSYLFYRLRRPSGTWTPVEKVPISANVSLQAMAVDTKGILHLTAYDDSSFKGTGYYMNRMTDGAWSRPYVLPGGQAAVEDMAVDEEGGLHLILSSMGSPSFYLYRSPDGHWSTPISLNEGFHGFHTLIFDHQGFMHEVWETPTSFLYRTTRRSDREDSVSISEQIAIPTDLHRPTLSFMYSLHGAVEGGHSMFDVAVTQDKGVTTTQVFSATADTPWTLGWVDMAPWAGQTVTVTVSVRQAANEPYIRLLLDDVSLGSWLTPVVGAVTPLHLSPGVATPITITGQNFVAIPPGTLYVKGPMLYLNDIAVPNVHWVDTTTLSAVTPPLLAGVYGIRVSNPEGQESALPAYVMVGQQVYLPVIRR